MGGAVGARKLEFSEPVRLDAERMAALYVELGETRAEAALCDAMERVALCLARIDRDSRNGDLTGIAREAHDLSAAADCIGMTGLARVARDVAECAEAGDLAALAAVLARLARVGDGSLAAIWDPQDMLV